MTIRDRVSDFRRVPARELLGHEGNPRTHPQAQRDALRGLAELGVATRVPAEPRLARVRPRSPTSRLAT